MASGVFAIADRCAEALLREGKTARARKMYQDVLDAYSPAPDREAAARLAIPRE